VIDSPGETEPTSRAAAFALYGVTLTAALTLAGCGGDTLGLKGAVNLDDRPIACRPSQLRIANGAQISEATGQNSRSIVLTNRGAKPCVLDGYPRVALLDARDKQLPFRISHSGDQMVTSHPPVAVRVLPHRSAYFVVNKYRCDLGDLGVAKKLRIALPGSQTAARLTVKIPTYPVIAYCGRGDPGSTVTVSPIEPTLASALWHP
jgi:Protein of unknown function (DUF4232)